MKKVSTAFIINQYQSGVQSYTDFAKEVGLWASEQYVLEQYFKPTDYILDIGCGAGRTTFGLFQLGFTNIIGLDLTPEMIDQAIILKAHFNAEIPFLVGDATKLDFENAQFDALLFSFNGLMSIPGKESRLKALLEINRVLKEGGHFIFTTHDREKDPKYFDFWKEQAQIWAAGQQDTRLLDFGDLITTSRNESGRIYIHIPNQAEVEQLISAGGFEVLETFYRSDQFEEAENVKQKSGACRFWVVRKTNKQHEKNTGH